MIPKYSKLLIPLSKIPICTFNSLVTYLYHNFSGSSFLLVQEKIDGIHISVRFGKQKLEVFSRSGNPIENSRLDKGLKYEIVEKLYKSDLFRAVEEGLIFYLEYLPRKKPSYLKIEYRNDARGKFYLLDIYSEPEKRFLSPLLLGEIAFKYHLPMPKSYYKLQRINKQIIERIVRNIVRRKYKSEISKDGIPEGIVLKAYTDGDLMGIKIRYYEDCEVLKSLQKSLRGETRI